ncbi:isoleucine-tRNA ligase [Dispira parvispora]|uniref:Isoleucine--tRNA ligase, mitochondrial n=1 Tax=Dispira parvispora TaxID=1520584 RepID=A0A9W8AN96_9FUNG|nr:isoleucine-tRNA ligase [Dispira parvispora]
MSLALTRLVAPPKGTSGSPFPWSKAPTTIATQRMRWSPRRHLPHVALTLADAFPRTSNPFTTSSAAYQTQSTGAKKYNKTLLLPKTDFPLRAKRLPNQAEITKKLVASLYQWQQENMSDPPFILHDGPPYANGDLHIGHALNRILKDIINRYQVLRGRKVTYIPGWDCHGLPIELKTLESLKHKKQGDLDPLTIRRQARQMALKTLECQKKDLEAWGILADWNVFYKTLDLDYEIRQLRVFQTMAQKGYIYRRTRPVYWSPSSRSALAEAELQYNENHQSRSIYVRFPLEVSRAELLDVLPRGAQDVFALVWTTTPWTLPANKAIAVNRDLEYALFHLIHPDHPLADPHAVYLATVDRLDSLQDLLGPKTQVQVVARVPGSTLVGNTYRNYFTDEPCPIIAAPHVTNASGTGLVHTAPGHGMEDYEVCTKLGIPVYAPVNDSGQFTTEVGPELAGKIVLADGSQAVVDILHRENLLLHEATYVHSYPYDWRTKKPVIQRATPQWFANLQSIQQTAADAVDDIVAVPQSSKSRLQNYVLGRKEWCISRQRAWGVPIPVLYETGTDQPLFSSESIEHIIQTLKEHGTDAWWSLPAEMFLPLGMRDNGKSYRKGSDTMDVWFDSGTSWTLLESLRGTPHGVAPHGYLADVYLEGSDQHRGWFQSSLLTSVAVHGKSPFRKLITHGFTLDEAGRKMSKSVGNVVDPNVVVNGGKNLQKQPAYGVDVLRLWVASTEYTKDMVIGDHMLAQISDTLRKFRNTARFMLGNLDSQLPRLLKEYEIVSPVDRYALYELSRFIERATAAYDEFAFNKVFQELTHFTNAFLSSFYFDVTKDRLYADAPTSPRRISTVLTLHHILQGYTQVMAPLVIHLAEDIYQHHARLLGETSLSTFCRSWPEIQTQWAMDPSDEQQWRSLLQVRDQVMLVLEQARKLKTIGRSLDADVVLCVTGLPIMEPLPRELLGLGLESLAEVFIVSDVTLVSDTGHWQTLSCSALAISNPFPIALSDNQDLKVQVAVHRAKAHKCPRCWRMCSPTSDKLCTRCEVVVRELEQATSETSAT